MLKIDRIFEEIRQTVRVSVFPVGLVLRYGVSSPIVQNVSILITFSSSEDTLHMLWNNWYKLINVNR